MNISCLICADDTQKIEQIREIIVKYCTPSLTLRELPLGDSEDRIPEYHSHIVILDVEASFERILRYVDKLRKKNAEAFFIVFVHYRTFSFSHDSMTLDHVDFLPKPLRSEALQDTVTRIVEQIRQRKDSILSTGRLQSVVNDNIPIIRQHYLSLLLRKSVSDTETVMSKFATLQIDCPGPYYTVVIADIPIDSEKPNYEAISFLVLNSLRAALKTEGYQVYIFFDSEYRINCLIGHEEKLQNKSIGEVIERVSSYCLLYMDTRLYYGIGEAVYSPASIHASYVQAERNLNKTHKTHVEYEDRSMKAALQFIEENLNNPKLDLLMVSSRLGFSRSYFSRFFHRTQGEGFSAYLQRRRIEQAKQLLLLSEDSIAEIAHHSGFSSEKYFFSVFKKMEGITPKQFRKNRFLIEKV